MKTTEYTEHTEMRKGSPSVSSVSSSGNETPGFDKAYLQCLDDTGKITRLEPLYDFARAMEIENRALREGVTGEGPQK